MTQAKGVFGTAEAVPFKSDRPRDFFQRSVKVPVKAGTAGSSSG
jgi:hypothetical protein